MKRFAWGRMLVVALVAIGLAPTAVWGYGGHEDLSRAAVRALERTASGRSALSAIGKDGSAALIDASMAPDFRGSDYPGFYCDDYVRIAQLPEPVGHMMPSLARNWAPHFARALQALRTESPVCAGRQLAVLAHFIEDAGAPPHAMGKIGQYKPLENWLDRAKLDIGDYEPRLLGKTDAEAAEGFLRRMEGMIAFSREVAERAEKAGVLAKPQRKDILPYSHESAHEVIRCVADAVYTLLVLSQQPQPAGASLHGTVSGEGAWVAKDARVVLLDAATYPGSRNLAGCATAYSTSALTTRAGRSWAGTYQWRHLPPGRYRLLAYRTEFDIAVSEPFELEAGRTTQLDLALPPAKHPGNLVVNPGGALKQFKSRSPAGWNYVKAFGWKGNWTTLPEDAILRCGAIRKDAAAKVMFQWQEPAGGKIRGQSFAGGDRPGEIVVAAKKGWRVRIGIPLEQERPLAELIERSWIVPDASATVNFTPSPAPSSGNDAENAK